MNDFSQQTAATLVSGEEHAASPKRRQAAVLAISLMVVLTMAVTWLVLAGAHVQGAAPNPLVGSWKSQLPYGQVIIRFRADGTYQCRFVNYLTGERYQTSGTYRFTPTATHGELKLGGERAVVRWLGRTSVVVTVVASPFPCRPERELPFTRVGR